MKKKNCQQKKVLPKFWKSQVMKEFKQKKLTTRGKTVKDYPSLGNPKQVFC
tara:strand:- start:1767 stop:1919 length:153 start_codon:yes stop_codon:yes gene_type:complete